MRDHFSYSFPGRLGSWAAADDAVALPRDADAQAEPDEAGLRAGLRVFGVVLFPLLMGLTSQTQIWPWLAIPLPPFGVPMTLQTLWVLLCALSIGPKWGVLSMVGYLIVGAIGVPLFSDGEAGVMTILGQTGGYLVGFAACQPVIGAIVRRRDGGVRGWGAMIVAVLAGHGVIFLIGVPWLYVVRRIDGEALTIGQAVYGGFVVFIPAMLLKSGIAVIIGRWAAPHASKHMW